jgi:ketosteroid isomerase-like protein
MLSEADMRSAVRAVLKRFFHLVSTRDMRMRAEFAPGDDVLLVGSDAGEIATGPQEIEAFFTRIFARASTFSWKARCIEVSQAGDIAWFFAEGLMIVESAEGQEKAPYRISGVLERIGDQWLWRQYHGSNPVTTDWVIRKTR